MKIAPEKKKTTKPVLNNHSPLSPKKTDIHILRNPEINSSKGFEKHFKS